MSSRALVLSGIGVALGFALTARLSADSPTPFVPNTLTRVGLYDAAHTGPDGLHVSSLFFVDKSRWMSGISVDFSRTAIDSEDWTYTGWAMSPDGGIRTVGFTDALHTRDDGFRRTWPYRINEQGVVLGASVRFSGMQDAGQSAFLEDRWGNRVKIGYYDEAHTATQTGVYKFNNPIDLNNRNQAIGYALNRDNRQTTAWLATSVGRIERLGLFDAAHTASDGTTFSMPVAINDAGCVIGTSEHFAAGAPPASGSTPWVRLPWGATRRIGLQAGIHRSSIGQHAGSVDHLTESGYMAGTAQRYRPVGDLLVGQTAWLTHIDGPNRPVGFYDGVHVTDQKVAYSNVSALNECGYAAGTSRQYASSTYDPNRYLGRTAWMARPDGTTIRVGLYDEGHTHGRFQDNGVTGINDVDACIGAAAHYASDGAALGWDAWVATIRGQTTPIGLTDARHTRADGYRWSGASAINDTGEVAGVSLRYAGMEDRGQTAWLYDRHAKTYVRFELSVRASDGMARSWITHLHNDGTAVGGFIPYAADGREMKEEIFVYTPADGVVRLSQRFRFGMDGFGWDRMAAPQFSYGIDNLVGPASGFDPKTGDLREEAVYWLHWR